VLLRSNFTRATAKFLIALFAISCAVRANPWLPHSNKAHPQPTKSAVNSAAGYHLDKDLFADRVTLKSTGFEKRISIRFGNLRSQELGFTANSADPGNLVAGDIDRDGDLDLIWVGSEQNSAVVLLNQGEGDFVEASDNQPYSSELDELFNAGDPPNKHHVKQRSRSSSLVSSTFSDIGVVLEIKFHAPIVRRPTFVAVERPADRLSFLTPIPKRGPPSILS
jgi:hypothetical protein